MQTNTSIQADSAIAGTILKAASVVASSIPMIGMIMRGL